MRTLHLTGRNGTYNNGQFTLSTSLLKRNQQALYNLFLLLFLFQAPAIHAQLTDSAYQPVVWLKADSGVVSQYSWHDISGRGHNAVAIYNEGPGKTGMLNYNPALQFDGINDYIHIPYNPDGLTELTVIAVFYASDSTTEKGVWAVENGLAKTSMLTTRQAAGPDSTLDAIGKNEGFAVINTVLQSWNKPVTINDLAYMALGSAGKTQNYKPFKGALAELLVFDKRLDLLIQLQWETYLAVKYGIALEDKNYISAAPAILWPAQQNKRFSHRITGLGRSALFGLHQKQSRSMADSDSLLTIYTGSLTTYNAANKGQMPEDAYLIWGDDNGSLKPSVVSTNADATVLNRKWKLLATGSAIESLSTSLRLNLRHLPYNPKGYWLSVNRNASDNFGIDSLQFILPYKLSSDSFAYYQNINWDVDRSGADLFSFMQAQALIAQLHTLQQPGCTTPDIGSVRINAIGGQPPYAYKLVNSVTKQQRAGYMPDGKDSIVLTGLYAGAYNLQITDAQNYTHSRTFSLTEPYAVAVDLGADQRLLGNNTITLDASPQVNPGRNVRYLWTSSYGQTASTEKFVVREPGIYTVTVTSPEGCIAKDEILITGAEKQRVEVFPTLSTDGAFNIGVSLPQAGQVIVRIFDLKGNKLDEWKRNGVSEYSFRKRLPLSGAYLVSIITAEGTTTKKVIIQK